MTMTIQSAAFVSGQPIPVKFTGEGQDVSPPLTWDSTPQATVEFALICDDPDAPTPQPWVHWLIGKLHPDTRSLSEHVPQDSQLTKPVSAVQGSNSWPAGENIGYRGPMPPCGHGTHHYHFKLFALGKELDLKPGFGKDELLEAMSGHILETAELVGIYERKSKS